ncbi:uncharacterized protein [Amphiura filiformis]|uniref:uncharacterized protein isoform X2 n=1 Tax=Amphiura filiformis TaxID=82378 RepID=UPI003B21E0CC
MYVTFYCHVGYYLDGNSQLQCIVTTSSVPAWNNPIPVCRGTLISTIATTNSNTAPSRKTPNVTATSLAQSNTVRTLSTLNILAQGDGGPTQIVSLISTIAITNSNTAPSRKTPKVTATSSLAQSNTVRTLSTLNILAQGDGSTQIAIITGLSIAVTLLVVLFVTLLIVHFYHRHKSRTNNQTPDSTNRLETRSTTKFQKEAPDYQNVDSETETYMGIDMTSRQPESVYQGMTNPDKLKSDSDYLGLDASSRQNETEYQSVNASIETGRGHDNDQDPIYNEIPETQNVSDADCRKTLQVPVPPRVNVVQSGANNAKRLYVNIPLF